MRFMALPNPQAIPPQVEPPAPTPESARSDHHRGNDISYFFDKSMDNIVCNICRQVFLCSQFSEFDNLILRKAEVAYPTNGPSSSRYEYSAKTGSQTLRSHIKRYHLELYLTLAKENEWKILLPGLEAQLQAANEAAAAQDEQPDDL